MAVPVNFCCLTILSAYFALTAQADCGTDCAFCAVQERFRKSDINPTMCMWQCEADFSGGSSWGPCRDLLQSSSAAAAATAASESEDVPAEAEPQDGAPHQLAKKYGGFMKRYGGFMKRYGGFMKRYGGFMKKSDETYGLSPGDVLDDNVDHGREILTFRTERGDGERGAADALSLLRELLAAKGADEAGGVVAKRYGGFMRRAGAYDSLSGGARPLQKRYGGFMRRVGWPEWLEESKRYGGFMRRSAGAEEGAEGEAAEEEEEEGAPEEQEPEMEKRYGGFMGY
ncbi:proenkephalin b [Sardina pilchardus]|uniref:proenkephalin b n=1 Tax=Sardina pilchardus TaxID=27697 RepID=UPI002E0D49CB